MTRTMAVARRRPRLPSDVYDQLRLTGSERPLAWAVGHNGTWYIGTDRALHLGSSDGFQTLPWEQIERADWHKDSDTLAVVEVTAWGQVESRREVKVADAGRLLELLRERVTKSVLINVFARVHGRRGLSVVGRRSPAGGGGVIWSYVLADGLDPADPAVLDVAERTLAEAEAELGFL